MASRSMELSPTTPDRPPAVRRTTCRKIVGNTLNACNASQKKQKPKHAVGVTKSQGKMKKGLEQVTLQEDSSAIDDVPKTKKRRRTKLNKKERDELLSLLGSVYKVILRKEIGLKLKTQFIPEYLQEMSNTLCEKEELLEEIIATHRYYFSSLYEECQKGPEPFLNFQLRWHEHCSAFLLSSEYS